MNANKQLINLAGILTVVVLLVAGIALIALPMYSESRAVDDQTRSVASNNGIYEQQIAILAEAGARVDEIDGAVAELRDQIAASPQLDDVHALVAAAAEDLDVRVVSVVADDIEPWLPRDQLDEEGNAVAAETPAPAADAATADGAEGDAATPSPEGEQPADGAAAPDPAVPAEDESPQRQLLVTITIDLALPYAVAEDDVEGETESSTEDGTEIDPDVLEARAREAAVFVDALGKGPRLISPIDVAYTSGKLVVSALAYFRTEDPQ